MVYFWQKKTIKNWIKFDWFFIVDKWNECQRNVFHGMYDECAYSAKKVFPFVIYYLGSKKPQMSKGKKNLLFYKQSPWDPFGGNIRKKYSIWLSSLCCSFRDGQFVWIIPKRLNQMAKPSLLNNHLREIDFFVIYFFCLQWKILNHFSLTLTHALLTLITWQLSSRHQRRNYRISIRIQFHKDINIQVVLHMEIWQWMNVDRKYLIPNVDLMRFFKDPSSLGSWNLPGYNLFIPGVYALVDFSSYCVIFYQKWVWCKKNYAMPRIANLLKGLILA